MSSQLLRGTWIVSTLTLVSRFLGFVRDLLFASLFGASVVADSFFVAFRIPNLLRSFVAEGALSSAFIPVFADELQKGTGQARRALAHVSAFLLLVTTLLSIIGVMYSDELVTLFAPGFEGSDQFQLTSSLLQVMMPYIICVSLVAMLNGALNSVHIFGAAAFAQVAMNLAMILGITIAFFLPESSRPLGLAVSVIVGGVLQILVQVPAMRRAGLFTLPARNPFHPPVGNIARLMIPAVLGSAVYQISIFINTILASLLVTGSVSWLFYADRLAQLPVGVLSVALSSVLLPSLSSARARGDHVTFERNLCDSLRFTSALLLPMSVGLYLYAEPLVEVLFQRGAFGAQSATMTALALKGLSLGLWAMSCHSLLMRAFVAQKDTLTPAVVAVGALIVSLLVALCVIGPLPDSPSHPIVAMLSKVQSLLLPIFPARSWGHVGLSLSSSVTGVTSALLLFIILRRRRPDIQLTEFLRSSVRSLLASLTIVLPSLLTRPTGIPVSIFLGIQILSSILVYVVALFVMQSREIQETFSLFGRILSRTFSNKGRRS